MEQSRKWGLFLSMLCCFQIAGVQECSWSCVTRSCDSSSGRRAASSTALSPASPVLAQLVTFAVMLPFIFSAPLIFTSWPGWVMTWHWSALPRSLSQHQQTHTTSSVCPGFPSQGCLYLSFALFPAPPKNMSIFLFFPLVIFRSF